MPKFWQYLFWTLHVYSFKIKTIIHILRFHPLVVHNLLLTSIWAVVQEVFIYHEIQYPDCKMSFSLKFPLTLKFIFQKMPLLTKSHILQMYETFWSEIISYWYFLQATWLLILSKFFVTPHISISEHGLTIAAGKLLYGMKNVLALNLIVR